MSRKYLRKNRAPEEPVVGRVQLVEPEPIEHVVGPDGLRHYDCPMARGVEPCRCGARALQGNWKGALDA